MNIKNLIKDSFVYGVTRYFTAFAALFLTPIYTRLLTKSDYGILDIFSIWSNLVVMVLPLGLLGALVRYYSDFSKDDLLKKKNLGSIFIGLIVLSTLYSLIMVFSKDIIIHHFIEGGMSEEIYYLSIFIVIAEIFKAYFSVQLQVRFEKYKYLIASSLSMILLIFFGFAFVYIYDMGVVGFFRASLLSLVVSLLLLIIFLRKEISFNFDWPILKNLLSYSVHLLSASFLFLMTNLVDRYLILHYYSLDEIGIYAIGVKISSLIGLATGAFTVAWFPIAMKIKDNENAKTTYKNVHNLYVLLGTVVLFALFIFRKELILIFAPDYMDSYRIISILCLFLMVHGTIFIYGLGLHIKNKTKYLTYSSLVSVIINIISSVILVHYVGLDGIAWGTLIGSSIWVIIQYQLCNKHYKIPYNYILSLGALLFLILSMFIVEYFDFQYTEITILSVSIKILTCLFVALVVYFIKIDQKTFKHLIRSDFN